jgi:hypothetical protein
VGLRSPVARRAAGRPDAQRGTVSRLLHMAKLEIAIALEARRGSGRRAAKPLPGRSSPPARENRVTRALVGSGLSFLAAVAIGFFCARYIPLSMWNPVFPGLLVALSMLGAAVLVRLARNAPITAPAASDDEDLRRFFDPLHLPQFNIPRLLRCTLDVRSGSKTAADLMTGGGGTCSDSGPHGRRVGGPAPQAGRSSASARDRQD